MADLSRVEKEIKQLTRFIKKLGKKNDAGQYVVNFGVLFDDDEAANTFEAIVGTLKASKRRKIIKFKGKILLKGTHDNVSITLIKGNEDTDTENTSEITDDSKEPTEELRNDKYLNNSSMIQIKGRCQQPGCKCCQFIENTSKWSKGKCKKCFHSAISHTQEWMRKSKLIRKQCIEQNKETISETDQMRKNLMKLSMDILKKKCKKQKLSAEGNKTDMINRILSKTNSGGTGKTVTKRLQNKWGDAFTKKLGECVATTFCYDDKCILSDKYILEYLMKQIGFDFNGIFAIEAAGALKYVSVDKFGYKCINRWGYNLSIIG